jgi:hypothetical protein
MRTAVKIIIYANVEEGQPPNFEDDIQERIESTFETDANMEIEHVEFEYEEY